MRVVNEHHASKARLADPTGNGFLLLAAEVGDQFGPLPRPSAPRRRILARIGPLSERLAERPDVLEATVFRAALRPPGEGAQILRGAGVRPARFDVVVLVRTESVAALAAIRTDPAWRELAGLLGESARRTHLVAASSPARIGDVDHGPDHWFLFNYFYGDDPRTVHDIWEYTAGWFQRKTALPNSVPLRPLPGELADYTLINHASWPALRTFLPGLLFRPTFRSFVLANFAANGIAAQPIIYRRLP
ncbi:hypothetical protein HGA13_01435 [Nocardia speluncae]|uniref:Uncharacterized protein n=1 Tax=Nocardia speluncae TaxID=419477 RepID=A0A846X9N9_9NOCA|nr:hypothetical protein [Nocardia speluncae]NKY31739.1 hypothetical protein [Nocardia speluncae]